MRQLLVAVPLVLVGCECLVPETPFDDMEPPPKADYTQRASWAAHPLEVDNADKTAPGETDGQATATVDVFYIHPTTYYSSATWNQPLDDKEANEFLEDTVLPNQASVYNATARVYAPRYRQATLGIYVTQRHDDAHKAMNLAYSDVRDAFLTYLDTRDEARPFIIAGHSQGAGHAYRLLAELFSELAEDQTRAAALRAQLVAGYVIGASIPTDVLEETMPGVPLCTAPGQTGCFVTWNAVSVDTGKKRQTSIIHWTHDGYTRRENPTLLCVNPITWRADEEVSERSAHLGAWRDSSDAALSPESVTARCMDTGLLGVEVFDKAYEQKGGNYHVYDYSLFYLDLRRDVAARAAAH